MLGLLDQTALVKEFRCNRISGGEAFFDLAEADLDPLLLKDICEPTFRQTSLQRHLPALESRTAAVTRSRFLSLVATTGGLAKSRTRTSSDTLFLVRGAF